MDNSFMRWILALTGGIPMLAVAITLVMIWIDPASVADGEWLKLGTSMVMIEFLLLHSGAFMSVGPAVCKKTWQQVLWFFAFAGFYGLFFIAIAIWIGQGYIAWLLTGVLLSRLLTLLILRDKRGAVLMLLRSTTGMIFLMLTLFLALIPWPELGVTDALRSEAFATADDALGEHPERFLAWGAIYFLIMSMVEFLVGWRLPDWKDEQVNESWDAFRQ